MKKNIVMTLILFILFTIAMTPFVESQNELESVEVTKTVLIINEVMPSPLETNIAPIEEEEVVEEVEEFKPYYEYTEEELDLLARCVRAEGETESYETKKKIASVVMNRVVSEDYFADTIEDVIYSPKQFSVTFIYIGGIAMIDYPADEDSINAAKEVLDYGSVLPSDVLYFYEDNVTNNWINSRAIYELADSTIFAYLYEK